MKMAWGRGLFRLWVALSVLWITFAVALSWPSLTNPHVDSFVFVQNEGDVAFPYMSQEAATARARKAAGEMQEVSLRQAPGVTYFSTANEAGLEAEMERMAPIMIGFYQVQQSQMRPQMILPALALAAGPPITLLGLGLLFSWVVAGFMRKPAR
jgi:hypothetical protein